ncbi:MAG: STAS domain-containing protein [Rhodoplanes sp.]|uniref:STAS domain-containing protein n=1 Tax=Rhodoplanes sp. TaxID=1968906 RepID=UPI0017F4458B|nr:STAS domain-containing protein [Rhodoplanes sp.]NVO12444.1 STAS domain-containing protein [Rhodoplanes sp.]
MDNTNQEIGFVDLDGLQTVRTIGVAHDRLKAAIADHAAVRIGLDGLEEFDLSLVQLVLAARRGALAAGKSLILAGPVRGPLYVTLDRAGFLSRDAADSLGGATFWLQASGDQ